MYCTNCGTNIAEGAIFCTGCGGQIISTVATLQKKPAGKIISIIRIIIFSVLVILFFITLFIYIKHDNNLIKSDIAGSMAAYLLIFTSIVSILAQIWLIFILARRWDIKAIIKKFKK